MLAGLFHGARTSLAVGLAAAAAAIVVGCLVGTWPAFAGGLVDEVLMRVTDAFQTVPGFLLALAFVSVVGPSLAAWSSRQSRSAPGPARRGSRAPKCCRSASAITSPAPGSSACTRSRSRFREILPNALPPVLALSSVIVAGAILIEAALSFLGLGDPNRVTWGGMIAEGRAVLRTAPFLSIIPGIALVLTVLGVYLVGEGVVEATATRRSLS